MMRYQKAGVQVAHFVWYRGMDSHIRAARIRWDGGSQVHFSWHVLEQYGERFSRDVKAGERVVQFIRNNYDVAFKAEEIGDDNENMNVLGGIRQGLLMGVYDDKDDIVHATTFVDHGHFFPDQIALMEKLDFERFLGSLTPGQRQAMKKRRGEEGAAMDG